MEKNCFIIGYIDDFSLKKLIYDLETTPPQDIINFFICSGGGSVTDGTAMQALIINEIKKRGSDNINGCIIGECSSVTPIISTAIPKGRLKIASSASFMLHAVRVAGDNNYQTADQLRTTADVMDKFNETLANQLAMRCGKPLDYIKRTYFNGKDYFFTAQETVNEGFADEVVTMELPTGESENEIEDLRLRKFTNMQDHYKLAAVLEKKFVNQNQQINMKNEFQASGQQELIASEGSNELQINSLLTDLRNANQTIATANNEIAGLNTQVSELSKELQALKGQLGSLQTAHQTELDTEKGQTAYFSGLLQAAKEENELTKYLTIEIFALRSVPDSEIATVVAEQVQAIKGNYIKTPDGYTFKPENKLVASNAETVVKHRIEKIRPYMGAKRTANVGSGYNASNGFVTQNQGVVSDKTALNRKKIMEMANRKGIVCNPADARFKQLCAEYGEEVF